MYVSTLQHRPSPSQPSTQTHTMGEQMWTATHRRVPLTQRDGGPHHHHTLNQTLEYHTLHTAGKPALAQSRGNVFDVAPALSQRWAVLPVAALHEQAVDPAVDEGLTQKHHTRCRPGRLRLQGELINWSHGLMTADVPVCGEGYAIRYHRHTDAPECYVWQHKHNNGMGVKSTHLNLI